MSALKKFEFETGTIEPLKEEKEYPHIIEELDLIKVHQKEVGHGNANKMICNKINEIIEVVNIMMRGGLR